MYKDPIVEEVRAARQRHALKFHNDLDAIVADMREKEKKTRPPSRLPDAQAADA